MAHSSLGSISLVKTRSVSSKDARRIVDLIVSGTSKYTATSLLRHAKTRSVSNKSNYFVLLKERSTIVGLGMYRVEKSTCIIYEMHVDAAYRSMGHGSVLMEHVLEDQGGRDVVLFVHRKNIRAQAFYGRLGFEPDSEYEDQRYLMMRRHARTDSQKFGLHICQASSPSHD